MPVWNALYQVRNFAANVENVRAQDATGAPIPVLTYEDQRVGGLPLPAGCVVVSYDIHLDTPGPVRQHLERRPRLLQLGDGADVFPDAA